MRAHFCLGALLLSTTLAACQDPTETPVKVDNRTPVLAEVPPPAISGGTMLVLSDDRVVVADPDRDRVHIVSISPARFEHDLVFEDGAEPGRSVEGSDGLVHVVLRGAGDLVSIDTNTGETVARRYLCGDPRGIDFDEVDQQLYVACADGTLVTLSEQTGDIERHFLTPDLRDVVIDDDTVLVSRLRSAEILEVDKIGLTVKARRQPQSGPDALPTVAWRMLEVSPGQVAMLHQFSSTAPVPLVRPGEDDGDGDDGKGDHGDFGGEDDGGAPYGGGGFCEPPIVSPGVSVFNGPVSVTTSRISGPTPAVDLAINADGQTAIAIAGAPEGEPDVHFSHGDDDFCFEGFDGLTTPGQAVAVAYLPDGRLLVQSREPSALYVYSESRERELTFELSKESRFDTGHDLYHRATPSRIACASCHPEGTDDGHVWNFESLGPRRTQSPEVGLAGSAPFHWDGDMDSFQTLSNEVYTHRMGGAKQSDERAAAFERWLFSAERAPANTPVESSLRDEGQALFATYGCDTCHKGSRMTNDETVDVRGKKLQVPSLRRVSLRPPFMHDGRAEDLRAAVLDMLEATRPGDDYSGHEVDAITAYLRTM